MVDVGTGSKAISRKRRVRVAIAIIGILILFLIVLPTCVWIGEFQFEKQVKAETEGIVQDLANGGEESIVTENALKSLPPPVAQWLRKSGAAAKPIPVVVRLKQRGLMRTDPSQSSWMEAEATQTITAFPPAFIWNAKIQMMPFLFFVARDKFSFGHGSMLIKFLSLFKIANFNGEDEKINQGALQRYLAEIVWCPSAALIPWIRWQPVEGDPNAAVATFAYKGTMGRGTFHFTSDGDFDSFSAERFRGGGAEGKLETWLIQAKEISEREGIRIPTKSEATWKLKEGDFTWYKLEVTDIQFNPGLNGNKK